MDKRNQQFLIFIKNAKSELQYCFCFLALVLFIVFCGGFIQKYSDTLMVVITFFYAVITFEMCRANIKSADATKSQLEESQRQHEESKRLNYRPYLYLKIDDYPCDMPSENPVYMDLCNERTMEETSLNFLLHIQNIGLGTAKDIKCSCEYGMDIWGIEPFPFQVARARDMKEIKLCFSFPLSVVDKPPFTFYDVKLYFSFTDLLEHRYSQILTLAFSGDSDLMSLDYQRQSEPELQL